MFTEQIAAMGAKLRAAGWDDGIAAAFEQLMGSCAATYSHRGTVNLPGLTLIQVSPSGQRADYVLPPEFTVRPIGVTGEPGSDTDWLTILHHWHIIFIVGPGPPTDGNGVTGTGGGTAGTGSIYIDSTTGNWYKNIGTMSVPLWSEILQETITTT